VNTSIVGEWNVGIKTPIGSLHVVYEFGEEDGRVTGRATSKQETVPLADVAVVDDDDGGQRVTWKQTVTKPMRLKLEFDVTVDGDRLSGHSRAGRLPRSVVTGVRRVAGT
jgi:hypothetical protein